jgi:hypothetical protein
MRRWPGSRRRWGGGHYQALQLGGRLRSARLARISRAGDLIQRLQQPQPAGEPDLLRHDRPISRSGTGPDSETAIRRLDLVQDYADLHRPHRARTGAPRHWPSGRCPWSRIRRTLKSAGPPARCRPPASVADQVAETWNARDLTRSTPRHPAAARAARAVTPGGDHAPAANATTGRRPHQPHGRAGRRPASGPPGTARPAVTGIRAAAESRRAAPTGRTRTALPNHRSPRRPNHHHASEPMPCRVLTSVIDGDSSPGARIRTGWPRRLSSAIRTCVDASRRRWPY